MPLPGVLPRQPSLLNSNMHSRNRMPTQQQAVKEQDTSASRATRAAQLAKQQAVRERDASARRVARATQPADQRQAARRGARTQRAKKQALHIADEVEGLVVHSLGAMSHRCTHYNALHFEHEKKCTTLCCGDGKMFGLSNAFPALALQPLRDLLTSVPSEHQLLPLPLRISGRTFVHTTLHCRWPQQACTSIPRNKGSA